MGRWCDLVAPNAVRPSHAPIRIPGPMPKYGQHSREILREIGYDDDAIESMLDDRVVALQWSEKYLPE